jgi:hypothetical protein
MLHTGANKRACTENPFEHKECAGHTKIRHQFCVHAWRVALTIRVTFTAPAGRVTKNVLSSGMEQQRGGAPAAVAAGGQTCVPSGF